MRAYAGGQEREGAETFESEDTFESQMRELERLYQQMYQQKVCFYVCVSMFQKGCVRMFQKVCLCLCLRLC